MYLAMNLRPFDARREPRYTPVVVQLRKGRQVAIG